MFYKYTTDITYITKSGRKKNKQERTWVSPKHKKGEVLALLWHSVVIASVYLNEIPTQLPGMLTHPLVLADLAFGSSSPNSLLHQPPFSNRCVSLIVTNSYLLTVLGPCLSLSSSSLIENLACQPFQWVLHQNRQMNLLTGAHPHPHPQNKCPPSCHTLYIYICIVLCIFLKSFFLAYGSVKYK